MFWKNKHEPAARPVWGLSCLQNVNTVLVVGQGGKGSSPDGVLSPVDQSQNHETISYKIGQKSTVSIYLYRQSQINSSKKRLVTLKRTEIHDRETLSSAFAELEVLTFLSTRSGQLPTGLPECYGYGSTIHDNPKVQVSVSQYFPIPIDQVLLDAISTTSLSPAPLYDCPNTIYDIAFWFSDLLELFQFFHANKIVHRNVSTANVRFDVSGRIKMVDLGYAHVGELGVHEVITRGGTPELFYPPPCWQSRSLVLYKDAYSPFHFYEYTSDWFALGLVLLFLLYPELYVGIREFEGDTSSLTQTIRKLVLYLQHPKNMGSFCPVFGIKLPQKQPVNSIKCPVLFDALLEIVHGFLLLEPNPRDLRYTHKDADQPFPDSFCLPNATMFNVEQRRGQDTRWNPERAIQELQKTMGTCKTPRELKKKLRS